MTGERWIFAPCRLNEVITKRRVDGLRFSTVYAVTREFLSSIARLRLPSVSQFDAVASLVSERLTLRSGHGDVRADADFRPAPGSEKSPGVGLELRPDRLVGNRVHERVLVGIGGLWPALALGYRNCRRDDDHRRLIAGIPVEEFLITAPYAAAASYS